MRSNTYFDNYDVMTGEEKVIECNRVIEDCEQWLQETSNPLKIRYRKDWIKLAKEMLLEVEQK